MLNFIRKNNKLFIIIALIACGVFFIASPIVRAQDAWALNPTKMAGATVTSHAELAVLVVGKIVSLYVQMVGKLVLLLVNALIVVASYNEFVNSPAVVEGWVIIRDVVNMFFIVILLVIAFATIFNVKEYKYQAMLPRLLIMAVVINFSRTIAGLIIDFGQVVMLTFVNGFKDAAGGNFVNALRIKELLEFKPDVPGTETSLGWVFTAFLLAAVMITVTAVVLIAMIMILVFRIVILWFLIVLSPAAFLASVWPSGRLKQNYAKWWDMFLDNVMVGPILAFFLWLSLLVLGGGTVGETMVTQSGLNQAPGETIQATNTKIGNMDNMISYLMGIGMLLGSLYMAQNMRSAGSGIAGAALGKMKAYATAGVRTVAMAPLRGAKAAGKFVAEGVYEKSGARAYKDALVGAFRGGKFGQFIGAGTKEYKDTAAALRSERALRATGQTAKADALRSKLGTTEQHSIAEKGLTNHQLFQKYKEEKQGSVEREGLAREMASRDLLRNNRSLKKYSDGDKRLEFALRSASYKAGNKEAFVAYQEDPTKPVDAVKDLQDIYQREHTSPAMRQKLYTDIDKEVLKDQDGDITNDYALEKLSVLEASDVNDKRFSGKVREKIKDAFLLAQANDSAKFNKLGLQAKYDEIFNTGANATGSFVAGTVAGAPLAIRQTELLAEQERLVSGQRKGAQEAGILEKKDVDKATEAALTSGVTAYLGDEAFARQFSGELDSVLESVGHMNAGDIGDRQTELQNILQELQNIGQSLDDEGRRTKQYDETGQEMSNIQLIQKSRLYQGVDSSKKIIDEMITSNTPDDKKKREAAAAALGVSVRDMGAVVMKKGGVDTEAQYVKANENYKKAEAKARIILSQAVKTTDKSKRAKEAKNGLKKLMDALSILEKMGGTYQNIAIDIGVVKTEAQRLKDLKEDISEVEVEDVFKNLDRIRGGRLS